jgi:DNA repair protein RadC
MSKYIPEFTLRLVREGTTKSETKLADSPARVAEVVRAYWGDGELDREHLVCLMLNARSQVIGISTVSVGTLSASLVHPREVFKPAVLGSAAGVVVVHNHPSGDASPSADDRDTTRRLSRAGEIMGIPLLDHVIIAGDSFWSFREHGLLG